MRTQLSTEAQASDSLAPTCQAASTKHTVATFNEHQILQTWFSNLNLNIFYSSQLQKGPNFSLAWLYLFPESQMLPSSASKLHCLKSTVKVTCTENELLVTLKRQRLMLFPSLKMIAPKFLISWTKPLSFLFHNSKFKSTKSYQLYLLSHLLSVTSLLLVFMTQSPHTYTATVFSLHLFIYTCLVQPTHYKRYPV